MPGQRRCVSGESQQTSFGCSPQKPKSENNSTRQERNSLHMAGSGRQGVSSILSLVLRDKDIRSQVTQEGGQHRWSKLSWQSMILLWLVFISGLGRQGPVSSGEVIPTCHKMFGPQTHSSQTLRQLQDRVTLCNGGRCKWRLSWLISSSSSS